MGTEAALRTVIIVQTLNLLHLRMMCIPPQSHLALLHGQVIFGLEQRGVSRGGPSLQRFQMRRACQRRPACSPARHSMTGPCGYTLWPCLPGCSPGLGLISCVIARIQAGRTIEPATNVCASLWLFACMSSQAGSEVLDCPGRVDACEVVL